MSKKQKPNEPKRIDPADGGHFDGTLNVPGREVFIPISLGSGIDQDSKGYLVFENPDGRTIVMALPNERFLDCMIKSIEQIRKRMYHVEYRPEQR